MTETDYAWRMSDTPSDPGYINTKALEGFMRHFDQAVMGRCGLGVEPPKLDSELIGVPKLEQQVRHALMTEEQRAQLKRARRLSFWQTFPPLIDNVMRRLRLARWLIS